MTDEEMISAFANATQTGNIKYALAVDGVVAKHACDGDERRIAHEHPSAKPPPGS